MTTQKWGLVWSAAREIRTAYGPRMVRSAEPTQAFWSAWRADKAALKNQGLSVSQYRGAWQVSLFEKIEADVAAARDASVERSHATDSAVVLRVPEGLDYLPYQRAGIAFGVDRDSILIADEMGLGKTIQAIGVANAMGAAAQRILVVCPASLKLNWAREWGKWACDPRPIDVVNGHYPADPHVVIVNYDVLHKYQTELRAIVWDLLIVDEAHFMKNAKARRTKQVVGYTPTRKAIAKAAEAGETIEAVPPIRARRRILLTGTPIANRPSELFPLIHYLDPTSWPNFFTYAKRYCAAHQNRYGWDFTGASNLAELQQRLRSSVMIRRLKSEVLTELPPKRRQVVELPADKAQAAVDAENRAWEARAETVAALQAAVELAKVSEDPADYQRAVEDLKAGVSAAFSEMSALRQATALAKLPMAIEFLREALEEGGKIVVFAHHKAMIAALAKEFGAAAVTLVGDTPMAARQAAVDRFQADPSCTLFLGSTLAAGVGITLTASSHVVFCELDWVPGNLSQAEDRCHRIGQTDSVLVQHLVLEGSLDATMAHTVVAKQEVIDRALDADGKPIYLPEPVAREEAASAAVSPDRLAQVAATLSPETIALAHEAVQTIAGMCDRARKLDGAGFSRIDTRIGHSLAGQAVLTPRQGALALTLARKYRGQLPGTIADQLQLWK